jgi:hypothetical protein
MMKATTTETGINEESRKRRIIVQKTLGMLSFEIDGK